MKKFLFPLVLAFMLVVFILPSANAAVLKGGDNLIIGEKILDDAYLLAGNGNINADVVGDLYIAGGTVTINGNVGEDLVVAGGRVTVMGDVLGDIRLIGGQVAVYGKVGEDVVVVGGQADIGKSSFVNGDLITSAGILTIDGQIKGNVRGVLGLFLLSGVVGGNVIVTVEDTIDIAPTAKIIGNLEYSSLFETTVPTGVVQGTVKFNKFEEDGLLESLTYWFFVEKIFSFLSSILILLLYILFAPRALISAAEMTKKAVLKSFGIGLLIVIAAVIGGLLLTVTIIGIPLALMVFAGLLVLFYVSQVFVAAWIGGYFFNYKKHTSKLKLFGILILTMFIYHLIGVIPYVGWALNLVLFLLGVGSIVMVKMDLMKFLRAKKMI